MEISDALEGNDKFDDFAAKQAEKKLAAWVQTKALEARQSTARTANEAIWLTNVAALLGYSNVAYNSSTRRFETLGASIGTIAKNRIHVNKILPAIQNRCSRLVKNKPKYDVKPNSNDPEDKEAAELSLQVLDYVWDTQNLERKRVDTVMWAQQCGHSYLRIRYDDTLGNPMIDPMNGEVTGYEGDIGIDVISAFEVFQDPLAKTFEESTWFICAKIRKLDYFKSQYGEKGEEVKEDQSFSLSNQYEARIQSLNTQSRGMSGTQSILTNSATEYVYYEKRSKKYPLGRMVITAGDVVLEDKPLPVGDIPLVKFDDIVVAGKYYSESVITHLRPIQDQFNRLYQKRAQWVNQLLAGKYLAPRGSELIKEGLNDLSGEVVHFTPVPNAAEVRPLDTPQIPAYAYKEEEALQAQLDDISGINQVSRGQLPSSSIPAIGMQFLTEQDDTRIGLEISNHEEAYARLGKLILQYAQKFYQTERLLKVGGSGLEYAVKPFTGADLKNNTDVIVIKGSALPGSKTLKRQEVLNLFQAGLMGDPADPKTREQVLNMLEFGDVAQVWRDQALDTNMAKKQIEQIEAGIYPNIDEFDNHTLILKEMERFRKSDKFERLAPEIQDLYFQVREEHVRQASELADPSLKFQEEQVQVQEQMAEDQMLADQMAQQETAAEQLQQGAQLQ
jgi:hypothetical protein